MAFSGKRVLITGGAGGLGLASAKKFHDAGASVIILDKNENLLQEAKKQFSSNVTTVAVDLLDWDETKNALAAVGPVDHLVNNAAIVQVQPFLDVKQEDIDLIFGVNFKAIVNVSQIVAKGMIEKGKGGTIVNISSTGGKRAVYNVGMYCCSKSAVVMLTKSMAIELAEHNIRVNCICPTWMVTSLTKDFIDENQETFKASLSRNAIKRAAEPAEVADSVIFLSGQGSTMITGEALDVDGGFHAT